MHWDQVARNWGRLFAKVRERWGMFSEGDIATICGDRDMLVGQIAATYCISREAADRQVRDWHQSLGDMEFGEGNPTATSRPRNATREIIDSGQVEQAIRQSQSQSAAAEQNRPEEIRRRKAPADDSAQLKSRE